MKPLPTFSAPPLLSFFLSRPPAGSAVGVEQVVLARPPFLEKSFFFPPFFRRVGLAVSGTSPGLFFFPSFKRRWISFPPLLPVRRQDTSFCFPLPRSAKWADSSFPLCTTFGPGAPLFRPTKRCFGKQLLHHPFFSFLCSNVVRPLFFFPPSSSFAETLSSVRSAPIFF